MMKKNINIEKEVKSILKEIGCQVNIKGYRFWATAVSIFREDKEIKIIALYELIAKRHKTSASKTERALRYFVEQSKEKIKKYFKVDNKFIPNSAFLILLSEELEERIN